MKHREKKWRWEPSAKSLRTSLTICVFVILLVNISLFEGLVQLVEYTGVRRFLGSSRWLTVVVCAVTSLIIGLFITHVALPLPMRPVKKLLAAMTRLRNGHFDERLDLGDEATMKEMADTFNMLAGELENTELLRSDFVNNFSHEFKTPIVSIRGFAKLLQRDDLTEKERQEYVNVIVDESTRLANMATNVLNLTKVENQSILARRERFNLSEQLRRCLLLLEKKWDSKELDIEADFAEYMIAGDEELLKQVWLNLLDNAVKFSPKKGRLAVRIGQEAETIRVSIHNQGPQINEEQKKRLFDKFWQGDTSHAAQGTGVGLSIVKKVVELHRGNIRVDSTPEETVFTVALPVGTE